LFVVVLLSHWPASNAGMVNNVVQARSPVTQACYSDPIAVKEQPISRCGKEQF